MTAAQLAALWAAVAGPVATGAAVRPPSLAGTVWEKVAAGKVARWVSGEEERRVVAVGLMDLPREAVWLSLTDDRMSEGIDGLTEVVLDGAWARPKLLYQRLDLPWPVADRHWVIRLSNNTTLATGTDVWERSWRVEEAALGGARARTDAEAFDASLAVQTNVGSWLLLRAEERTLAIYQAKVSLGGAVPDGAVDAYTRAQLEGMFEAVAKNAGKMGERYGAGCAPQPGGDGRPIPCFD